MLILLCPAYVRDQYWHSEWIGESQTSNSHHVIIIKKFEQGLNLSWLDRLLHDQNSSRFFLCAILFHPRSQADPRLQVWPACCSLYFQTLKLSQNRDARHFSHTKKAGVTQVPPSGTRVSLPIQQRCELAVSRSFPLLCVCRCSNASHLHTRAKPTLL